MDDDQRMTGRRASRAIVAGVSAALAAIWLVPGVAVDENRPLRDFPDLSQAGLASASDFRAIDGALIDRLPAKGSVVAVLGNGLIGAGLSPTDTVFRGPSGEPFLSFDFTYSCVSRGQVAAVDELSRSFQDLFAASGVDFVWAIAPDKSAIDRDELGPAADLLMSCSDANRADLEAIAESPGSPMMVGWDELLAERENEPVYLWGDTHWNSHGAAVFAELIIDRLGEEGIAQPGVFDRDDLVEVDTQYPNGGLFQLMGGYRVEPTTMLASEREGVVTTHELEVGPDGYPSERWVSTGPDLIPGRTLILHDSFFFYNHETLAPYFADLTSVYLPSIGTPAALAAIDGYDHVIIQQVQRQVPFYVDAIPAATWITAGR